VFIYSQINRGLPCCFLAAILYEIQDSSKEAAGKQGKFIEGEANPVG
jgi:hypothetical protein